MGQINIPSVGSVYVDANAVIYWVENIEPYASASAPLWVALNAGLVQICTSELTLLEVLVKPLRDGNQALVAHYRNVLLGTLGLDCLPIRRPIIEIATQCRAKYNLRTPDAIHAASALESGCVMIVTNDPDFQKVQGLSVTVLSAM